MQVGIRVRYSRQCRNRGLTPSSLNEKHLHFKQNWNTKRERKMSMKRKRGCKRKWNRNWMQKVGDSRHSKRSRFEASFQLSWGKVAATMVIKHKQTNVNGMWHTTQLSRATGQRAGCRGHRESMRFINRALDAWRQCNEAKVKELGTTDGNRAVIDMYV